MTKYLQDQPFTVGLSSAKYASGWDAIFAKCPTCRRRKSEGRLHVLVPRVDEPGMYDGTTCTESFHDEVK